MTELMPLTVKTQRKINLVFTPNIVCLWKSRYIEKSVKKKTKSAELIAEYELKITKRQEKQLQQALTLLGCQQKCPRTHTHVGNRPR